MTNRSNWSATIGKGFPLEASTAREHHDIVVGVSFGFVAAATPRGIKPFSHQLDGERRIVPTFLAFSQQACMTSESGVATSMMGMTDVGYMQCMCRGSDVMRG